MKVLKNGHWQAFLELVADGATDVTAGEFGAHRGISPQAAGWILQKLSKETGLILPCESYREMENVKGHGNFCGMRTVRCSGWQISPKGVKGLAAYCRDAEKGAKRSWA